MNSRTFLTLLFVALAALEPDGCVDDSQQQILRMRSAASAAAFRRVPSNKLYVSEPNPSMFGNSANDAKNPNWSNANWLKSRFHFSFAEYNRYKNQEFGVLRVLNDDLVQPARGFGAHPHRNMEILTYVVHGFLSHKDSMGTAETLAAGAVQFMTAGSGVTHSEHNLNSTTPLRFIQIWIRPNKANLKPNYGSASPVVVRNQWQHFVSDVNSPVPTPVKLNQNVNIFVAQLDAGIPLDFEVAAGRQAYLVCIDGTNVSVSGADVQETISAHDGGEFVGPAKVQFKGATPSHFLVIEMAYDASAHGRGDL